MRHKRLIRTLGLTAAIMAAAGLPFLPQALSAAEPAASHEHHHARAACDGPELGCASGPPRRLRTMALYGWFGRLAVMSRRQNRTIKAEASERARF